MAEFQYHCLQGLGDAVEVMQCLLAPLQAFTVSAFSRPAVSLCKEVDLLSLQMHCDGFVWPSHQLSIHIFII